jgi:prepilin-type N-terminal cleavage/methylation domain-containing protein
MQKRNGFTLIEILIAIFILATVLTTVYAAYTGTFRIVKDTAYADDIYSMARGAMKRMTEDLESSCKHMDSFSFTSVKAETEMGEFTELSFLSFAHLDFDDEKTSGIAVINYFIVEDDEKESCVLKRRDELYMDKIEGAEEDASRKGGYALCNRLQSLAYKFYDSKGEEYDSWDSNSDLETQKDSAPSVVSIQMDFINPDDRDKPYRFMTKVFLPMAGSLED